MQPTLRAVLFCFWSLLLLPLIFRCNWSPCSWRLKQIIRSYKEEGPGAAGRSRAACGKLGESPRPGALAPGGLCLCGAGGTGPSARPCSPLLVEQVLPLFSVHLQ